MTKIPSEQRCKYVRANGARCQAPRVDETLCSKHAARRGELVPVELTLVQWRERDDPLLERAEPR